MGDVITQSRSRLRIGSEGFGDFFDSEVIVAHPSETHGLTQEARRGFA